MNISTEPLLTLGAGVLSSGFGAELGSSPRVCGTRLKREEGAGLEKFGVVAGTWASVLRWVARYLSNGGGEFGRRTQPYRRVMESRGIENGSV